MALVSMKTGFIFLSYDNEFVKARLLYPRLPNARLVLVETLHLNLLDAKLSQDMPLNGELFDARLE